MDKNFSFKKTREDIVTNKEQVKFYKDNKTSWTLIDSSLSKIGNTFLSTLPEEYLKPLKEKGFSNEKEAGVVFKKYIEDTLANSPNKERMAVEFGGPGEKFFSAFSHGFFERTAGVFLNEDSRRKWDDDLFLEHFIIQGDILDTNNKKIYDSLDKVFKKQKADFILSRMMGPLNELKMNPLILEKVIRIWYKNLNENGLMFLQFEYISEHHDSQAIVFFDIPYEEEEDLSQLEQYVKKWVYAIKQKFPNEIDIQLERGMLRLHKEKGAPEELPKLNELFH